MVLCWPLAAQNAGDPPYLNPDLTPQERAADLVSRMTLDEKALQMQNAAPAIPRLGVPEYDWWNEGLHGVARAGLATVFPQAIGLAATWDMELVQRIGAAISTEARAKYNEAQRTGDVSRYHGLTFWSPNINILRDPRWGRGQETYGEDPFLTSRMSVAFIKGMQGSNPTYLKTVATAKHFAVHSGPEPLRHVIDVHPSAADLHQTYLPAFRASAVEGHAGSVMCAVSSIDGVPACANTFLLNDRLRGAWNFDGYVVSDCGAVTDITVGHKYVPTLMQAAAVALLAGTDLVCGTEYSTLPDAVRAGLAPESALDRSAQRLFAARMSLGMFDPPERVPYSQIPYSENDSPAHRQLALEAARKSIVLLKNNGVLPLDPSTARIAVIGPAADEPDPLLGNYNGIPSKIVTALDGIRETFGANATVQYALGSTYTEVSHSLVSRDVFAAGGGLLAEYFDNPDLTGAPKVSRSEPRLYFNYDMRDPAIITQIPRAQFSVRWSGSMVAPYSGNYLFGAARTDCEDCTGTDSLQIFLDGEAVVNDGTPQTSPRQTQQGTVSLVAGQTYSLKVEYRQSGGGVGIELVWIPPADALLQEAEAVMKASDVTIVCVGLNSDLEGEEMPFAIPGFLGGDRTDINLPALQQQLLNAAYSSGKPVVIVLMNGGSIAAPGLDSKPAALLQAWYGGEEAGHAIASTLSGGNNPAGRLPVTFYQSIAQLPPFEDYSMAGRTYRFFQGQPLYPFGFGLSYSTFQYSGLLVSTAQGMRISALVTNISRRDGDEVVQLYVAGAVRELKGLRRIHLKAGESRTVQFTLNPDDSKPSQCVQVSVGGGQPFIGSAFVQGPCHAVAATLTNPENLYWEHPWPY